MTGFEPATSGSTIRRSNQLSYTHHEDCERKILAKSRLRSQLAGNTIRYS